MMVNNEIKKRKLIAAGAVLAFLMSVLPITGNAAGPFGSDNYSSPNSGYNMPCPNCGNPGTTDQGDARTWWQKMFGINPNNPPPNQSSSQNWWDRLFGANNNQSQNQNNYTFRNDILRRLDEDAQFRNDVVGRLRNDENYRSQFLDGIRQEGTIGRMFADRFQNDPQFRNDFLDRFQNDANFRRATLRQLDQWSGNMMDGQNNMMNGSGMMNSRYQQQS